MENWFMIRPRWYKIASDLARRPIRSLLVIASISVGPICYWHDHDRAWIPVRRYPERLRSSKSSQYPDTSSHFEDAFVQHIRNMTEIAEAEGAWNAATCTSPNGLRVSGMPISIKAQDFGEGSEGQSANQGCLKAPGPRRQTNRVGHK
jgi:hypothetical protein